MKTVNSISGGQTSAYIAANYPADFDLFALVTSNDPLVKYPDDKLRQKVSDKIGREFIGTLEDDTIIHTIFDLEQFIGREITWVAGIPFEDVLYDRHRTGRRAKHPYLPNVVSRFCTENLKLVPMFEWWHETIGQPVEMRIGFRANETPRAKSMVDKLNDDGFTTFKYSFEKTKDGRNKWSEVPWQRPRFPLIEDNIYKDNIIQYWRGKGVRFAIRNNCVGCFHRPPGLLAVQWETHTNKMEWFSKQEKENTKGGTWIKGIKYEQMRHWNKQLGLFEEDFSDCDTGYCGL